MNLDELLQMVGRRPRGPRPFFTAAHVLRAVQLVAERPVSRRELAERLKIGEGSVRTILSTLRKAGLVDVVRAGVRLSEAGRQLLREMDRRLSPGVQIPAGRSTVDLHNVAIVVKGGGHRVSSGVEQRDAAMAVGSSGASTFVCQGGRLIFPGMATDMETLDPAGSERVKSILEIEEGDALVIGSARDVDRAHLGAIAAALTLLT